MIHGMTTKIAVSLPDDVAEYLRSTGNASSTVAAAVRHLMTDAQRTELSRTAHEWAAWQQTRPAAETAAEQQWIEESNDIAFSGSEW